MRELPDYCPHDWKPDRLNQWLAVRPSRVLGWIFAEVFVSLGLVVVGATTGLTWLLVGAAVVSCGAVIQGAIYVPRAWRAMRDSHA